MRYSILFFVLLSSFSFAYAQGEFSGGFKAGLNFNNFIGPEETANEVFSTNTGFHIGASFVYSVTDLFGIKAELMYSQKGVQQSYDGPSYFTFYRQSTGTPIYAKGNRKSDISIANSYIDIPLMVYYKIGSLELEAGVNAGILVGTTGSGGITFSGSTIAGSPVAEFTTGIDYGYYSDEQGLDAVIQGDAISLNTVPDVIRPTNINAYYEAADNDENLFRTLDFGLNAGMAFFLNRGLYVGVRANYGLTDVTNENQDLALEDLDSANRYITRDDQDQNISVQASVGFRF